MSAHTPGPWLWGTWTILDEDRPAQRRGEPYWTFIKSEFPDSLARGPYGRKARETEHVIQGTGYECDGIHCNNEADAAMIQETPETLACLERAVRGLEIALEQPDKFNAYAELFIAEAREQIAKAKGEGRA